MINGAHSILFSTDAEADSAFFRDVFGLGHIDAGQGWLIFALPPSEVAFHPLEKGAKNAKSASPELYLMTHDVEALLHALELRDVESTPVQDQGWGLVTEITLPSGAKLPIYQPRHERPSAESTTVRKPKKGAARKALALKGAVRSATKAVRTAVKKAVKAVKAGKTKAVKAAPVAKPVPKSKKAAKAVKAIKAPKTAKKRGRAK